MVSNVEIILQPLRKNMLVRVLVARTSNLTQRFVAEEAFEKKVLPHEGGWTTIWLLRALPRYFSGL